MNDLLEHGASVTTRNKKGQTPLHTAAVVGKLEMVQLLMLKGAVIDAMDDNGWTPLYDAVYFDRAAAAVALLAAGANVNLRSDEQAERSPLHVASGKAGVSVLRALIEHGADINAVDVYQDTALHRAALGNGAEAIDFLVKAGSNISARNEFGCVPLHCAGQGKNVEALRCLLGHGADVNVLTVDAHGADANAPRTDNRSVLYVAALTAGKTGSAEFVDLLLRSGADETITDRHNRRPLDVLGNQALGPFNLRDVDAVLTRVYNLLKKAPADRAWRRRGYLAMCRAHPVRLKPRQEISSSCASVAPRTRHRASCDDTAVEGGASDEKVGDDWASVMARVLELQEEGIFRTIVGYL